MLGRLLSVGDRSVWKRGERAAERHMRSRGYSIIARNLKLSMGEIDLLCEDRKSGCVVVVEVKARAFASGDSTIDPERNITSAKKAKLRTLTKALMKQEAYRGRSIRIDVIAVEFVEGKKRPHAIRHYESAV